MLCIITYNHGYTQKKKDVVIEKNIARIFQQFNIVEYKSPSDRATIEDYHKTQCYSRLYAVLNKKDIADMSVTIVATRYPKKLMKYLSGRYSITHIQPGIYLVEGDTSPTQVVVSEELSDEDNLWLNCLRNDLTVAQFDRVDQSNKQKLPMDAYFQAIGNANAKVLEDLYMQRQKGVILTEKLDAYFREKFAPDVAQCEARGKVEGGRNTILAVLRARFKKVPRDVEKAIRSISDPIALESWAVQAATCQTLDEFAEAVK